MKKINILLVFIFLLILAGCQNNEDSTPDIGVSDVDVTTLPYFKHLSEENPVVTITVKNLGVMKLQLFPSIAPNTVNNFIDYVVNESYTNSTFHRVIEDFMIQGGMVNKSKQPIPGDFFANGRINALLHERGIISMARTNDPNSATSQFFIMHKDSPHLDGAYAAFGGLISGFNVLDQIATAKTNRSDAPVDPIVIESMTVDLKGYLPAEVIYIN